MGPTSYINPVTITPAIFRMDVSDSLLFFLFWWLFFFYYPVRGSVIWAPDDGLGSFYLFIRLTRSAYTSLFELALSSVISASNKCIKKNSVHSSKLHITGNPVIANLRKHGSTRGSFGAALRCARLRIKARLFLPSDTHIFFLLGGIVPDTRCCS